MVNCAFAMRGQLPLALGDTAIEYAYADPDDAATALPAAGPHGSGRLCQGTLYAGRTSVAAQEAELGSSRTLLAGWIAPPGSIGTGSPGGLQDALDRRGAATVRELRGDFVIAHLSRDHGTLRLYRGLTSMVALFWRTTGGCIRWSTNPSDLLDGGTPRLSDVALDLLPMILAERGFPHDRSWFSQVHRLPAGACLTLRPGRAPVVDRVDAFAASSEQPRSVREAADGLRARLEQACRRPVGAADEAVLLLSGGIDSAAVAYELGRTCSTTAVHFTIDAIPGFDGDRRAAASIADACHLEFVPYDMGRHVSRGGDYTDEAVGANLPQTHVPLRGIAGSAQEARTRGARFVFAGILADQVMAHDWQRGLIDVAGWSSLNPLVTGEPIWQTLQRTVRTSFDGSASPGARGYLRHLRGLLRSDPTLALPNRDVIVHPVGFSDQAAQQVTDALRTAARRAREQLRDGVDPGRPRGGIPAGTTSLFQINETFNTPNVQAGILNHFLPQRCFFTTPYADRDVIEYALSLPNVFRVGLGHGATIDKFALRLAYGDSGVPPQIGRRMQQARIDVLPAVYVNQNFDRCRALLGEDSRLRAAGVLSDTFVDTMSRQSVHRNGEEIARLCVIEKWLRRIAP